MGQSQEDGRLEEDPFWEIALNYDGGGKVDHRLEHSWIDSDSDEEDEPAGGGKAKTYRLPNSSISLQLAPLASDDGVWSPVGDHAWYSSALLTCLILQGTSTTNTVGDGAEGANGNERSLFGDLTGGVTLDHCGIDKNIRILELGSGAIGLPGISFASLLSRQKERFPSWTVTLTDNDRSLLRQLKANVRCNIASNQIALPSNDDESLENGGIHVKFLDWDIERKDNDDDDTKSNQLLSADIVVGSELCYTRETADVLLKVLLALLDRNPAVKIWIVQVTDRYGWKEIVIPALESEPKITIETIPLTYEIHEVASTMIPMGGALDRYAFGAFCISNDLSR